MKKYKKGSHLGANIRKLARILSKKFYTSSPVRVHPQESIVNENSCKVYPIDNKEDELLESIKESDEPFIVNNEILPDDESTVCSTNINSICSDDSITTDIIDKSVSFDPTKFNLLKLLGSGSYGTVFLADYEDLLKKERPTYAIKKFSKDKLDKENMKEILAEKNILSEMDNPFILRFYGTCQTKQDLYLITEVVDCGELFHAIYDEKLSHESCVFYTACIILGIDHIHSKDVVFRDLKPENIMIDSMGYPRIIDFGLAKRLPYIETFSDGTTRVKTHSFTICGTPEYFAPEIILNEGYNHSVDIWALGVIMYEMIQQTTPFSVPGKDNLTKMFSNIVESKQNGLLLSRKIDKKTDGKPNARNLITQLLSGDPTKRLGNGNRPKDLLNHPYFSGYSINEDVLCNRTFKPPCLQPNHNGYDIIDYEGIDHDYNLATPFDQEIFKDF